METTASDIRLSAQRALLGAVPSCLRAVSVEVEGTVVRMRSIFDFGASDADKELLSVTSTEIIADFSSPFTIEEELLVLPTTQPMVHLTHLVYLRHEF